MALTSANLIDKLSVAGDAAEPLRGAVASAVGSTACAGRDA